MCKSFEVLVLLALRGRGVGNGGKRGVVLEEVDAHAWRGGILRPTGV